MPCGYGCAGYSDARKGRRRINDVAQHLRRFPSMNGVEIVPHNWPFILPASWRCLYHDPPAQYRRSDGLNVLCSCTRELDGKTWLHVSFSYPDRLPLYSDIIEAKRLFIGDKRTAYQVFPPLDKHVNTHPYCLRLWCCLDGDVTPDFTRGNGTL